MIEIYLPDQGLKKVINLLIIYPNFSGNKNNKDVNEIKKIEKKPNI